VFSERCTKFLFGYVAHAEASRLIDVCFPFAFCALGLFLFPLIAVAWLKKRHLRYACAMRNWRRVLTERWAGGQRTAGLSLSLYLEVTKCSRSQMAVAAFSVVGTESFSNCNAVRALNITTT
jgi:hypothetical protein